MKILHINTSQKGGAALCARRIHEALKAEGIESKMLLAQGDQCEDVLVVSCTATYPWSKFYVIRKIQTLLCKMHLWPRIEYYRHQLEKNKDGGYYTIPLSDYNNLWENPLVQEADIIHLHWVKDFLDYPSFFQNCNKPIVWTLHDKNPAVGLMHYCSEFFPIPKQLEGLDKKVRKLKRKSVLKAKNLHLVAISESMVDICKKSDVLKGFPTTLIHNGVDTQVFAPIHKNVAEEYLKNLFPKLRILNPESLIFLFSAHSINDYNKGIDRLIQAIESIDCPDKVLIAVGGIPNEFNISASFPLICTGRISDQNILSKLYSAADYFLQASYEETFAQTPLEAMSCGTPVISTPCSGAADLIRPFNGIICNGFDSNSLAAGIHKAMERTFNPEQIRSYIIENYEYNKIAKEYIDLYNEVLRQK